MANCFFAKPNGMQHCCIPFFMLLIPNVLLILARHTEALEEFAAVAEPDTLLAWYRKLIANKFDDREFASESFDRELIRKQNG
jgi:hypothetical protein